MAKINAVGDLPKWFDLSNYARSASFDATVWYVELRRRAKILVCNPEFPVKCTDPGEYQYDMGIWRKRMAHFQSGIREVPFLDPQSDEFYMHAPFKKTVSPVTFGDLALEASKDHEWGDERGKARWRALDGRNIRPDDSIAEEVLSFSSNYPVKSKNIAVWVELGASDAVLKDAFAAWLRETRQNQPKRWCAPKTPIYDRWTRYGILPYLDLITWSIEQDVKIPDRVMAPAVMGYPDAGEEKFRKTVKPLAAMLMQDLSELYALATLGYEPNPEDPYET